MTIRILPLLALLVVSCAPKTFEIKGECYIVTAGRETVQLTGTTVYAIPLDAVETHISSKLAADSRNVEDELYYVKGMPQEVASATVDQDGKFSFSLPRGQYALVAMDSRRLFSKTEFYYWVVEATPQTTLSNSNLNGAGDSLLPRRFSLP
jgi:hypothetical protein